LLYRRANAKGATYFFTVNLADRRSDILVRHVDDLRAVINKVKEAHPFSIVAMVVLPEHLHAIWRLPPGDRNFPMRWSLIKAGFSRLLPNEEYVPPSRAAKRERGIWQRRYWEHQIRDEADVERHVNYIHYNPVKHGHVQKAVDWPHSTLHSYIERGIVNRDWAGDGIEQAGGYGEHNQVGLPASAHATSHD